jgi:hypothetical protein
MNDNEPTRERGRRASVDRASGEVHGAGSGTGGDDDREDYDDDPQAGGGSDPIAGPSGPDRSGGGRTRRDSA